MKRPSLVLLFLGGLPACGLGAGSFFDDPPPDRAYNECVQSLGGAPVAVDTTKPVTATADLLRTTTNDVNAEFRARVRVEMNAAIDQAKYNALVQKRCGALQSRGGEDGAYAPSAANAGAPGAVGGGGASQVSGTNNQVAGVDEADFVKNDTKYLYIANGTKFRVIDAWPATAAHEIASVDVPGTAEKLFVQGNRAVVYSSLPADTSPPLVGAPPGAPHPTNGGGYTGVSSGPSGGGGGACTYGYNCTFTGDGTQTAISVFDVTNRAAPVLVRTITTSSSLIAARRIGNAVHTVVGQSAPVLSTLYGTYPADLAGDATEAQIAAAFEGLRRDDDAYIAKLDASALLPRISDSRGATAGADTFRSSLPDGTSFTTLLSIDMTEDTSLGQVTIMSRPGAVYASASSLYIAVPHEQSAYGWYDGVTEKEVSTVHKFAIGASPSQTAYLASGIVKGRVLNQFSMDEASGFLRIATTTGHLPDPSAMNTLSVLVENGSALAQTAQIDGIAPGEDIRSVRFDGDRGYVVTFKKTDPLFVFDLSDPGNPKSLAELKIPGFSTYMHMMDASHLLTIGYDANDHGDFAFFDAVILQIFDVTDPLNPALTHKERIGTRGSSSEALADHLAFNYFAPKNLLAIPMTICEGGGDGTYGTSMTFSGLIVYDVTAAAGFSEHGRVPHPTVQSGNGYDNAGCSNWWSDAKSEVKRSVIMDNFVFSISESRVKVNALDQLATDVLTLPIK